MALLTTHVALSCINKLHVACGFVKDTQESGLRTSLYPRHLGLEAGSGIEHIPEESDIGNLLSLLVSISHQTNSM